MREWGKSRQRSLGRGSARGCRSTAAPSAASASTKYIGHAPVVTAGIAEDQDVAGARSLGQRHIGGDDVVLHAEPAHQMGLAAADGIEPAAFPALAQDP